MSSPPQLIAIDPDDYHAAHVGRTASGQQFFITNPFEPSRDLQGHAFVARFLFNAAGQLCDATIDDVGPRRTVDRDAWQKLLEQREAELGWITRQRIVIAPFEVERFGLKFGLIPRPPEGDDDESWWVELHPGNYMAFHEPWDSGWYDT